MEDYAHEIAAVLARTAESELFYPTASESEEIALRASVFADITESFPVHVGKHASNEGREEMKTTDATLTYGEVDFVSLAEVFSLIKSRYGGLGTGVFYDLGSVLSTQGSGKGVIAGAVLHPFQQCKGIEILPTLHRVSMEMKEKYDVLMPGYAERYPEVFPVVPEVSFQAGSFFDVHSTQIPYSDACCFFANSTCFSMAMMQEIAAAPLKIGSIAITLTKNLPGSEWLVLESFRKKMSWGEATVYIHRRVDPAVLKDMKSRNPSSTYWYT